MHLFSGVVASVVRLGYQVSEAKKPNLTKIVIIISLMKYVHLHCNCLLYILSI